MKYKSGQSVTISGVISETSEIDGTYRIQSSDGHSVWVSEFFLGNGGGSGTRTSSRISSLEGLRLNEDQIHSLYPRLIVGATVRHIHRSDFGNGVIIEIEPNEIANDFCEDGRQRSMRAPFLVRFEHMGRWEASGDNLEVIE